MTQQRSRYRRTILLMLLLAMVINYIDRSALSIAMPFIAKDFSLTAGDKGLIFSAFSIGYALFNFLGGYFSDRFGARKVLTSSMTFWSMMCGLTAFVSGFWSLLSVRILFGAGEGPNSATANKMVNNWFPLKERASAAGINQAGGPIGGAISGPLIGALALSFGWQASFIVMSALGLLWAVTWHRLTTETPATHPRVNAAELAFIDEGQTPVSDSAATELSVLDVIKNPSVFVTGISLFCYNYILFFFITWFPSYLVDAKGISLKDMSMVTALPWVAGAVGFLGGGVLVDAIFRKTGRQMFSRKVVLVGSLCMAAICIGLTGVIEDVYSAVGVMTVAIGLLMLTAPAYWAIIQDTVPRSQVGTASGFMHGLANVSGIVGPTITGYLIQGTGSYASAFILAGTLGIIGAAIIAIFVGRTGSGRRRPVPSAA